MSAVSAATGSRSILDAATALFADEGFDSVSVAAIAERAGVCKANVFHHFPSKDALYLAVMKATSDAHADYAEQLLHAPGSSADKVRRLIEFEIRNMLENPQRTRLMLREIANGGHARVRNLARNVYQRNFTAVVNIFEQGRRCGEFAASVDPAAAAMLVGGATNFYFNSREVLREFREVGGAETPDTYAQRIAALILSGVERARAPRASGAARRRTPVARRPAAIR